jgi:hypothetical protein
MISTFTIEDWVISTKPDGLPSLHDAYCQHARLAEQFESSREGASWSFVCVGGHVGWPFLTVSQRSWPTVGGFPLGVLLVPETKRLFIGSGERLLAYDLDGPERVWEDRADTGFWSWRRRGEFVLMSAELEFAAWDTHGTKLWSTFVEPPWSYEIDGDSIRLDVMGDVSSFPIRTGR